MFSAGSAVCETATCVRPLTSSSSKRHAVVREDVAVLVVRGLVLPGVVADAVADVEQTVVRQRDRDAGREITERVLSAEPVGDEADRPAERLLVPENRAAAFPHEGRFSAALVRDDAVASGRYPRTVIAFVFHADV